MLRGCILDAARSVPTSSLITNYLLKTMDTNKSLWGKILNIVITVLTAIATTFGVTSCIGV